MLNFLHLSDLHFTTTDAGTQFDLDLKIREALLEDLGKDERTNFDAILVTGDIAYHGRTEEFARAKDWLEEVRMKTLTSPEALYVVPGNHDVNRDTVSVNSALWELHQSLRQEMLHADRLKSLEKKLQDSFDFLTALKEYRNWAAEYGCPTNPKELAWVQVQGSKTLDDGSRIRFHGLNSALISDDKDKKANLLLSNFQFGHFDASPNYVNIVLCHHPPNWLIDSNQADDYFRNQAQVVLCGHEHDTRCYKVGKSLRVFAGAVHPNPREQAYEPCYHVLRLFIDTNGKRELVVRVETRVWLDKDKCFGPLAQSDGSPYYEEHIDLPTCDRSTVPIVPSVDSNDAEISLSSPLGVPVTSRAANNTFAAARRKLIVHFFRLGTIARYEAAISAGVWEESDDGFDSQARWARVFDRAEKTNKLDALWRSVAEKDETLTTQPNPFKSNG